MLLAAEGGAGGVVDLADSLFREAVSFGVLASGQEILPEQLESYLPRIAVLATILQSAEPAGLHFSPQPFPYMNLPHQARPSFPLAGTTQPDGGPSPLHVLNSLTESWAIAMSGPQVSRFALLLAALWQAHKEGLWSALELAINLSTAGYLLNRSDLETVITTLLAARNGTGSDDEMVSRLLGGADL